MSKEKVSPSHQIQKLIETGIPVSKAVFHQAVNNGDNHPENYFSEDSHARSRNVEMWWTPHGLLCVHKEKHFIVPPANVIFANFK